MSDINVMTVSGRLVRDPELKTTSNGNTVASFRIANNTLKKTNFFDVSLWGKPAETLVQYAEKGRWISLSGRMEQDEWEDKEGNKRTSYSIVADNFNFLGSGKKDDEATGDTEATKTTEKETVPF
tara:strand:- start:135 stop:509 length:375 start_codon:yes stop_codon:yes gene_type:complete